MAPGYLSNKKTSNSTVTKDERMRKNEKKEKKKENHKKLSSSSLPLSNGFSNLVSLLRGMIVGIDTRFFCDPEVLAGMAHPPVRSGCRSTAELVRSSLLVAVNVAAAAVAPMLFLRDKLRVRGGDGSIGDVGGFLWVMTTAII